MRVEDVHIKISVIIITTDGLFSKLMVDKISSTDLLKSLREPLGGLYRQPTMFLSNGHMISTKTDSYNELSED